MQPRPSSVSWAWEMACTEVTTPESTTRAITEPTTAKPRRNETRGDQARDAGHEEREEELEDHGLEQGLGLVGPVESGEQRADVQQEGRHRTRTAAVTR